MENTALKMFQQTILYKGENIWVKQVCEFFEISVQYQHKKIKNDIILGKLWTKTSTDLGILDDNGRILLSKKGFIRWIQIINTNTIAEHLREKFITFQELIFDFMYGSIADENNVKFHYTRLQKLEKIYSKISSEIKKEKVIVTELLNGKYNQLKLDFDSKPELALD